MTNWVQEESLPARKDGNSLAAKESTTVVSNPPTRGLYVISVAADLVGTGPQNLRLYERKGLLEPERAEGGTRRYSEQDLATLRRIGELLSLGLSLCGIRLVLVWEKENESLRTQLGDRAQAHGASETGRAPLQISEVIPVLLFTIRIKMASNHVMPINPLRLIRIVNRFQAGCP